MTRRPPPARDYFPDGPEDEAAAVVVAYIRREQQAADDSRRHAGLLAAAIARHQEAERLMRLFQTQQGVKRCLSQLRAFRRSLRRPRPGITPP